MKFEVCVNNLETAAVADKLGCDRVELCSALSVGGLTPSFGLIKSIVNQTNIGVHVMIRHAEGDFVISDSDLAVMLSDVEMAYNAGANGIVFGCLTVADEIDLEKSKILVDFAKSKNLEVTFHRAFDFVSKPFDAIEQLINIGVDRILTSGQKQKAIEGIDLIERLTEFVNGRIEIMAGSGVNDKNAVQLAKSGISALHFTASQSSKTKVTLGMGSKSKPDRLKIESILNHFK